MLKCVLEKKRGDHHPLCNGEEVGCIFGDDNILICENFNDTEDIDGPGDDGFVDVRNAKEYDDGVIHEKPFFFVTTGIAKKGNDG